MLDLNKKINDLNIKGGLWGGTRTRRRAKEEGDTGMYVIQYSIRM
jgi:hypothetical protein